MEQQINAIHTISIIILIFCILFFLLFAFAVIKFFFIDHLSLSLSSKKKEKDVEMKKENKKKEKEHISDSDFCDSRVELKKKEKKKEEDTFYETSPRKTLALDETIAIEEETEPEDDFWAESTVLLDGLDEEETKLLGGEQKVEDFKIKQDIVVTHGRRRRQ